MEAPVNLGVIDEDPDLELGAVERLPMSMQVEVQEVQLWGSSIIQLRVHMQFLTERLRKMED